jgi:hypothetical protein
MRLTLLQLPCFTKEIDECETIFEKIIYVLKHMEILQRMPFLAQSAVFIHKKNRPFCVYQAM